MKIFTEKYPVSEFIESLPYFDTSSLFLDIETTGFSADRESIYLLGTAFMKDDFLVVKLYFAETPANEKEILSAFSEDSKDFDTVITFNGDRFDLPFISKRMSLYKDEALSETDFKNSLDLLKTARGLKNLLGLSKCNQKSVEAFLGIDRKDEKTGGELIEVYKRYSATPSQDDEELLTLHNFDDVKGMIRLLPILSYEKILSEMPEFHHGEWDHSDALFIFSAETKYKVPVSVRVNTPICYIMIDTNKITFAFKSYEGILKYFLPYPAQYVYLIREQTCVPKMLAEAIPSSEKRPAKRDECFLSDKGIFIPVVRSVLKKNPDLFGDEKTFSKKYDDDILYIKTDPQSLNLKWFSDYASLILRSV